MKKYSSAAVWIVCTVMLVLAALTMWQNGKTSSDIAYSTFIQKWDSKEIQSIIVREDKMTVEGKTSDGKSFTTYVPSQLINSLIEQKPNEDVKVSFEAPSSNSTWMPVVLPCILFAGVILLFMFVMTQQSQGGGGGRGVMNFGKSKAKMMTPDSQTVTFADVAGADEEKAELEEIVDFLKLPAKYIQMGARIPKGILLVVALREQVRHYLQRQ